MTLRTKKHKNGEARGRFSPLTVVLLILLVLYSVTLLYLLWWAISSSMKINQTVFDYDPYGLFPAYWKYRKADETSWEIAEASKEGGLMFYTYRHMLSSFNWTTASVYGKASKTVYLGEMYLYSFLYAGGSAVVATLVPCITAYCCAKFNFKFSKFLYSLVIVVMMIPIVGNLPSQIQMSVNLGIMNEIWGVWILKANFLGLYFLVFYESFKSLPMAYTEAAKIDGANNFQIFAKICLPIVRNTFFTIMLMKFIECWNDYQTPQVFMNSYPTVAFNLNYLMNASLQIEDQTTNLIFVPSELPARMAAVVLAALPLFIVFIVFQKRLLGNLTVGGIKG